jgi:hypothetical protein
MLFELLARLNCLPWESNSIKWKSFLILRVTHFSQRLRVKQILFHYNNKIKPDKMENNKFQNI